MQNKKTTNLVLLALFAAIIFILAFTPIGYLQLGVIKATIIHIPVIVGSILLGPKKGAVLGFLFGLTSLISNTFTPVLMSFAFSPLIPVFGTDKGSPMALFICFLPRIMVGIVPYYVYQLLDKLFHSKWKILTFTVSGILGSLTNTLLVMNGIYFIFKDSYAAARSIPLETVYSAVLAIIFGNGIPEAIVAGIVTSALCKALMSNKQIRDMIS
ncbi:ECF transporter S component [Candidatus Galacturonibacter soehngenii]|uniref:ECF transporter S component n=1 Tax=Candidatus Galacturonatibacter soehngenii TaxID=2307010 RepID=A0A7V7QIJ9_9FIRM|nr:ECF transporter S component [Candidatus Galacturonibacter soehngenii]KAB1436018.1 ECF transporter S component [Candidatus Galacturonibacter soehngenii]MBA4686244.1 ECF transporter S component [Candidatus Galacturonibacter soehngenii]